MASYLPSENELCQQFSTTRTTIRKALDELVNQGYIAKEHGRGSKVVERMGPLGLLTIRGFSGSVNQHLKTVVSQKPAIGSWDPAINYPLTAPEKASECVYFQRIRYIKDRPVAVENNWYALDCLKFIDSEEFIEGSFFKTLSRKFLIEITEAEQQLRAVSANESIAGHLEIEKGSPVLHISVRFRTSKPGLNLYGDLYCDTSNYPVGHE